MGVVTPAVSWSGVLVRAKKMAKASHLLPNLEAGTWQGGTISFRIWRRPRSPHRLDNLPVRARTRLLCRGLLKIELEI